MSDALEKFVDHCNRLAIKQSFDQIGQDNGGIELHPKFVSLDRIDGLDEQIRTLNKDVIKMKIPLVSAYTEGKETKEELDRAIKKWLRDWMEYRSILWGYSEFFIHWRGWVNSHYSTFSRTGATPVKEFESFRNNYNAWLQRFEKLQGPSTAKPYREKPTTIDFTGTDEVLSTVQLAAIGAIVIGGFLLVKEIKS